MVFLITYSCWGWVTSLFVFVFLTIYGDRDKKGQKGTKRDKKGQKGTKRDKKGQKGTKRDRDKKGLGRQGVASANRLGSGYHASRLDLR